MTSASVTGTLSDAQGNGITKLRLEPIGTDIGQADTNSVPVSASMAVGQTVQMTGQGPFVGAWSVDNTDGASAARLNLYDKNHLFLSTVLEVAAGATGSTAYTIDVNRNQVRLEMA